MAEDPTFRTGYIEGVNRFQSARQRAFLQDMIGLLRGKPAELLSFDDIRGRLRLREESYRGLQDVPLDKIQGSVGRYHEFNNKFLPRRNDMRERWSRVYAKVTSMEGVPPIDLYKVGDVYFVRDGNHRVSVAHQMGAKTIQAHVTELHTAVPVKPGMTLKDMDDAAEYLAFLEETGLNHTRPHHQSMRLSEPARYRELLGHIYIHAQVLEQVHGGPVSTTDAAADWYDNVYRPAVTLIRKYNILEGTKERDDGPTEADLYLWMVDHLRDVRHQMGSNTPSRKFSDALVDYLTQKKIPIPRELLDEDDKSVFLSRTQVMQSISQQMRQQNAPSSGRRDNRESDVGHQPGDRDHHQYGHNAAADNTQDSEDQ
jgi:hypothetical protein